MSARLRSATLEVVTVVEGGDLSSTILDLLHIYVQIYISCVDFVNFCFLFNLFEFVIRVFEGI